MSSRASPIQASTCPTTSPDGLTHLLLLDFEATCERRKFQHEIIEFPTLVYDLESNSVTETFHEYVRPVLNPKLTPFCKDLTGIQQVSAVAPRCAAHVALRASVDEADTFDSVWTRFLEFLATHGFTETTQSSFAFLTCGDWDLNTMLPQQHSLSLSSSSSPSTPFTPDPRFQRWLNLKTEFAQHYPEKRSSRGMVYILHELDLDLNGRHHSGIDDCTNIPRIVTKMREDRWEPWL